MMEAAIFNHAARILSEVGRDNPADAALRKFFAFHRGLGPRERRAISRTLFAYFRWMQWVDPKTSRQKQLATAWEWQERFAARPDSVKPEAMAVRAVPTWLATEMDLPADYLRSLQLEPPLWLRARPGTARRLAEVLGHCKIFEREGFDAVRYQGQQDLFLTESFRSGAFEIQDLASQWVSVVCAPQPGETWWDRTAGEGGKSLHLADLMQNRGVVWAADRSAARLAVLQKRAARAKLYNIRPAEQPPRGASFDGILVDAPCSGVGTWQRNPHARWTTGPDDVAEMAKVQRTLLDEVAPRVKPGGRLVYAVCTLTRSETTAVTDAFSTAHPEFERTTSTLLYPHEWGCNGMFVAAWTRRRKDA